MTGPVGMGKSMRVVYLGFSKAFDLVKAQDKKKKWIFLYSEVKERKMGRKLFEKKATTSN